MEILYLIWYASLFILVIYYQVVFLPRQRKNESPSFSPQEGVSITIAVKNGTDLLGKNLAALVNQDYTAFEVIIVDDHSEIQEQMKLQALAKSFSSIQLIHSDRPTGKKHALMQGIEHAQYPYILFTDADCKPESPRWITSMMVAKGNGDIVLGYSPYETKPGFLNLLIRFDTIITAMQYISWTMLNRPYMGVGRNMLFSKNAFTALNPLENNLQVPYGDDDALVQAARGKYAIDVALDPSSFVVSQPHTTWKGWLRQKHRHLSAGFSYSRDTWWQAGVFAIAMIVHWAGAIALVAVYGFTFWIVAMIIALVLRWIIYVNWAKQLRDYNTAWFFPLLELCYATYLGYTGLLALFSKRRTWN